MRERFDYLLERWLLRGATHRLAVLALLVVAVSVCGGFAVLPLGDDDLTNPFETVWWAFLRLTDPGYLGDDQGAWRRVVSTGLTISGYVLFMGALIAVMTQALDATLSKLERGETPIVRSGHILVVGWTDRSVAIVRQFLLSTGRVQRFLSRRGQSDLHVVLLLEELSPAIQSEVAERFGDLWDESRVTLRAGSRMRVEHLQRAAFTEAAAIVLPGSDLATDFAGSDIAAIKTLLSIAGHPDVVGRAQPPRVVAEVFDNRKVPLAAVAYAGDLDVVPSDLHISRLMVQNLRNPGLSHVYGELLTYHQGAEIYVRLEHPLEGLAVEQAAGRFEGAVLLGVVRRDEHGARQTMLNPPGKLQIRADDRLVLMARSFEATAPHAAGSPRPVEEVHELQEPVCSRRVLVLGWSDKLATMLAEMAAHHNESWAVTCASVVAVDERVTHIAGFAALPAHVTIEHVQADFTLPEVMRGLQPGGFDSVVLLGSDWLRSDEEADARSLVGYLTLRMVLREVDAAPHVLVEITDPSNASLFDEQRGEVVVSPLVISNLLAHVTLRSEILGVFDVLFSAGGPSFWFRDPADYGLAGTCTFDSIAAAVRRRGHVAAGLRRKGVDGGAEIELAPPRETQFVIEEHDLVVMAPTTVGGSGAPPAG